MDKYDRLGNLGVEMVIPLLETIAHDGVVRTVAGSKLETDLQAVGVDLVLWQTKNHLLTVEVKASNLKSERFFIEGITDIRTLRPGWLHKLKVDLFTHVHVGDHKARLFRWDKFKTWFDEHFEDYRQHAVIQVDDKKSAIGYCIPWKDIAYGITRENFGTFNLDDPGMWHDKLMDMNLN